MGKYPATPASRAPGRAFFPPPRWAPPPAPDDPHHEAAFTHRLHVEEGERGRVGGPAARGRQRGGMELYRTAILRVRPGSLRLAGTDAGPTEYVGEAGDG